MKTNVFWRVLLILVLIAGPLSKTNPVKALGTPQIVGIDPSSPAPVGTNVSIHATVQWDPDFRSMRICFRDENWCQEDGSPDLIKNFDTSGLSAGTYTIIVEVAAVDRGWDTANKTYGSYELTGPSPEPTPIPPPKGPNISIFDFSPSSANVGDSVNIHIKVDSVNPGATKLNVSCGILTKNETSEVEFYTDWNTSGCPIGSQTVTVLSRDVNDPDWRNPSSATRSYDLNTPPVPVQSPIANFWADATSVSQGQCTYLHWDTAYATSVDIDGSGVSASGSMQVCPSVTQKFTLSAYASPGGVDAKRNITITVTAAVQQPPDIADSFQTGDVINIGGNIYVIVDRQRRHVPNPETLDALGIGRSLINNKGFSDSELLQIAQGPDIPDVNIDPAGFASFKEAYLPNLAPIVPKPPTQVPTPVPPVVPTVRPTDQPIARPTVTFTQPTVMPTQQQQQRPERQENPTVITPESKNWFCQNLGLFCPIRAAPVQCTAYVYSKIGTTISKCIGTDYPDAAGWTAWTNNKIKVSNPCGVSTGYLSSNSNSVQSGDIIVWGSLCSGALSDGHVALFLGWNSDGTFRMDGSNWSGDSNHTHVDPSCMSYIHIPTNYPQPATQTPPTDQTVDKCIQYKWPWSWLCKWGLIK